MEAWNIIWAFLVDMLMELARREKEYHIRPDPDIDAYMKVNVNLWAYGSLVFTITTLELKTESFMHNVLIY